MHGCLLHRGKFCWAWFCLLKVLFLKKELDIFQIMVYLTDSSLLRGENIHLLVWSCCWHHWMWKSFLSGGGFSRPGWRWWGQSAEAGSAKLLATTLACCGGQECVEPCHHLTECRKGCCPWPLGSSSAHQVQSGLCHSVPESAVQPVVYAYLVHNLPTTV